MSNKVKTTNLNEATALGKKARVQQEQTNTRELRKQQSNVAAEGKLRAKNTSSTDSAIALVKRALISAAFPCINWRSQPSGIYLLGGVGGAIRRTFWRSDLDPLQEVSQDLQ